MDKNFFKKADNVYRTKKYIVKQNISFLHIGKYCCIIFSNDIFYHRNKIRDCFYKDYFDDRGTDINGKRVHSTASKRRYVL